MWLQQQLVVDARALSSSHLASTTLKCVDSCKDISLLHLMHFNLTVVTIYSRTIDEVYVDGVSITYGSTLRKHIWTYASGLDLGFHSTEFGCPCNNDNMQQVPPYVGSDYYCETGAHVYTCCETRFHLYSNDILWDG